MIRRLLQPDAELLDDPSPEMFARIAGLTNEKKFFPQHWIESADKTLPHSTEKTTSTP